MADTYQPPFESCVVQGKASGIMCAYNRLNGVPTCADHHLLTVTARNQWKFNGLGLISFSRIHCCCFFVPPLLPLIKVVGKHQVHRVGL